MLALLLLFAAAQAQICPKAYQRFSDQHTFCRPLDPQCDILQSIVTKQDQAIILDEHNKYRSRVALGQEEIGNLPKAANMLQMEWDDELSAVAQHLTNLCLFQHDCSECREVINFPVGQNLYISNITGSETIPGRDWKAVVKAWYDEVVYFNRDYISPFVPASGEPTYEQFSQVVWADTWRIGCGYTMSIKGDTFVQFYACNYGPGGNIRNGSMYDEGKACSECPITSCCGKSCGKVDLKIYPGLCKIIPNYAAPIYKPTRNYLFNCDFRDQTDCSAVSSGTNEWLIYRTLSGNYLSIVLQGGETSALTFSHRIKPDQSDFCFIMEYRSGPDIAGQESANSASVEFYVPADFDKRLELRDTNVFMKFSVHLGWRMATQVAFNVTVPSGKPPQFFEIRNLTAIEGKCE